MKGYKVGDLIGGECFVHDIFGGESKSGMGVVYLVTSREVETPFVLKTYQILDSFSKLRQSFLKEAEAWVNLSRHPNIVQAYWVREIANQPFVAAEFISGDDDGRNTITHFCQKGPVPLTAAIKWGCQFCFGMLHAAKNNIIAHRDIKPANLMVDSSMNLRITDFGLVKSVDFEEASIKESTISNPVNVDATDPGTAIGTFPYMAPEQFTDAKSVDHRADIYSFGIVLFEMVSGGQLPFVPNPNSKNIALDFFNLHASAKIPKIKSDLFPIIEKCLEKHKEKRYQSYNELLGSFYKIANKLNITCPQPPTVTDNETAKHFVLAKSLAALGKPGDALKSINTYLAKNPKDPSAWVEKGRILHENYSSYKESIQCTLEAIRIDPFDSHAWNNLGLSYKYSGELALAIDAFKKGLDCDPYNTGCMINLSIALIENGKPENAHAVLSIAVGVNPKKAQLWLNLGSAAKILNRPTEAIGCFEKAVELNQRLTEGWRSLAFILEEDGKLTEALGILNKGLVNNRDDYAIRLDKARLLDKMGNHDEATKVFSETESLLVSLTQKYPGNLNHWHNLGLIYLDRHVNSLQSNPEIGNADAAEKAIICFSKVIQIDENDSFALWTLARLYFDKHDAKKTIMCCNRLLRFPQYVLKALSMKAQVLSFVGLYKEAAEELQDFLRANPTCDSIWFILAQIHEYHNNPLEALKCLHVCSNILSESKNPNRQNMEDVNRKIMEINKKIKRQ